MTDTIRSVTDPTAAFCSLCQRVHQGRERTVPCRNCGRLNENYHAICPLCWPMYEKEIAS